MLDLLVMTLLRESNRPLAAYDIAERSRERGSPLNAAQVYRVLDRLTAGGEVQRIELLSAWLVAQGNAKGFLVCRCCRSVQGFPISAMQAALDRLCEATGFSASRPVVEAWGLCAECADQPAVRENITSRRKDRSMMTGMKTLLALTMTVGTMVAAVPVDAAERRPGGWCQTKCTAR